MEDFAILITSSHGSSPNTADPGQGWTGYKFKKLDKSRRQWDRYGGRCSGSMD